MTDQSYYISRKLTWIDDQQKQQVVVDNQVVNQFIQPIVILGEPGMGKTRLMEQLGALEGCEFIRATSFMRKPDDTNFGNEVLIIDGLDEVAAIEEGDPLHNVLKKLVSFGKPRFIISCRSAEWSSVMGKLDISDEYGVTPLELALEPLTEDDAQQIIEQLVGFDEARETIFRLNKADLNDLYSNPLTLNFLATLVATRGTIPETRAALYELAVAQLRLESNQRHGNSKLAQLSEDDALDAAGLVMASLLMTGCDSITSDSRNHGVLSISDLTDIGDPSSIQAVLGSNLFRLDSMRNNHFLPLHRTVAEYLGARWLTRSVEMNDYPSRTAKRLLGLISAEGGVPASLRGLHAWLPRFSPELLGPKAIDRDPYGILRYGDGDNLTTKQAQQIIKGLRQLATFDPYFRTDWRGSISLKGLASEKFISELRDIITDGNEPFHLRSLILEAINGSSVSQIMQADLEKILFDENRTYHERDEAGEAICNNKNSTFDWSKALEKLIELGDENSTRLAAELLDDIGFNTLTDKLIARVVTAESGILNTEIDKSRRRTFGTFYKLASKLPVQRISSILDELTATLQPMRDPEKWWSGGYHEGRSEFTQFSNHLILRQLQHNSSSVTPQRLWDWVRTLQYDENIDSDERIKISTIIQENTRLRQGVQRLVLFSSEAEMNFFQQLFHLERLSKGFALTDDDARQYLTEVVKRKNSDERSCQILGTLNSGKFWGHNTYLF